jgi:hypothetical protein
MKRCTARSSRTGEPCRRFPVRGATVCPSHGGRAPQVQRAAELRLAEATVRASLAEQGVTLIGNPLEAFQRLTSEVVAFKEFAAAHMARLGDRLTGYDKDDMEYLRAAVTLYERALDRAGRFLHDWVRLGLDERLVQVTEGQATIMVEVLTATLRDLGHDIHQAEVAGTLRRHLLLVQGDRT